MSKRAVRDRWQEEILRTTLVKDSCRVLLLHMATAKDSQGRHLMTERGYIRVPREKLADSLGVKQQRITDRITEATRAGLLVRVGGGVNGQTAQYAVALPAPEVSAEPVPQTAGEVSAEPVPEVSAEPVPQTSPGNGKTDTSKPIPQTAPEDAPGIGRTGTIRARARVRATYGNRDTEPAPDGSRAEPHHDDTCEELRSSAPTPAACSNEGDTDPSRADETNAKLCRVCGQMLPYGLILLGRDAHASGACPSGVAA